MPIDSVVSWKIYRDVVIRDILQGTAVSRPTDDLLARQRGASEDSGRLDRRNFVFSAAHLAMENSVPQTLPDDPAAPARKRRQDSCFQIRWSIDFLSLNIEDLKAAFNAGSLALGLFVPAEDRLSEAKKACGRRMKGRPRLSNGDRGASCLVETECLNAQLTEFGPPAQTDAVRQVAKTLSLSKEKPYSSTVFDEPGQ